MNFIAAGPAMRRHALRRLSTPAVVAVVAPLLFAGCVANQAGTMNLAAAKPAEAEADTDALAEPEGDAAVAALAPAPERQGRQPGTISGSTAIDRMIEEAAAENGVPRELAFAVVHVESRYNPRARGAGVYGLSQIMPSTARSMGFSGPTEALYDPKTNLRYGMKYLKGAWEKGGRDICKASMKYKGGHRATTMTKSAAAYCANVKRHIASIGGMPSGPAVQETQVAAAAAPGPASASTVSPASVAMAPTQKPASPAAQAIEASRASAAAAPANAAPAAVKEAAVETAAVVEAPAETKPIEEAEASVTAPASTAPDPARFGD